MQRAPIGELGEQGVGAGDHGLKFQGNGPSGTAKVGLMPREGWLCKPFDALRYGLSAAPSLDQLSLRELEAFPCPGLTGFFAFFHARIATQ